MTDCFALLDEPRRPWLAAEELKQKFLTLSAKVHPDRFHQAAEPERNEADTRYAELNRAYQTLSSSRDRLRHLLALERGKAPEDIQQTPADLMDLFFECGQLCQGADEFLKRKDAADSPLLKVELFQEGMDWSDKIQGFNERLNEQISGAEQEVKAIDERWVPDRDQVLPELEGLYRRLSYYARWLEQTQTRFTRLAM